MVARRLSAIDVLTLFLAFATLIPMLQSPLGAGIAAVPASVMLSPFLPPQGSQRYWQLPAVFVGGALVALAWTHGFDRVAAKEPWWVQNFVVLPMSAVIVIAMFYRHWRKPAVSDTPRG